MNATITFGNPGSEKTCEVRRISLTLGRSDAGTWSSYLAISYDDGGKVAWVRLPSQPRARRQDAFADLMANVACYFDGLPTGYPFTLNGKRRNEIPSYLNR